MQPIPRKINLKSLALALALALQYSNWQEDFVLHFIYLFVCCLTLLIKLKIYSQDQHFYYLLISFCLASFHHELCAPMEIEKKQKICNDWNDWLDSYFNDLFFPQSIREANSYGLLNYFWFLSLHLNLNHLQHRCRPKRKRNEWITNRNLFALVCVIR